MADFLESDRFSGSLNSSMPLHSSHLSGWRNGWIELSGLTQSGGQGGSSAFSSGNRPEATDDHFGVLGIDRCRGEQAWSRTTSM